MKKKICHKKTRLHVKETNVQNGMQFSNLQKCSSLQTWTHHRETWADLFQTSFRKQVCCVRIQDQRSIRSVSNFLICFISVGHQFSMFRRFSCNFQFSDFQFSVVRVSFTPLVAYGVFHYRAMTARASKDLFRWLVFKLFIFQFPVDFKLTVLISYRFCIFQLPVFQSIRDECLMYTRASIRKHMCYVRTTVFNFQYSLP